MKNRVITHIFSCLLLAVLTGNRQGFAEENSDPSILDFDRQFEKPNSLLLVPIPITEPAIGFGLALGAMYLQSEPDDGSGTKAQPNISGIAGLKTKNDSKGLALFDSRKWGDGGFKSKFTGISGSVNLDFYTPGEGTEIDTELQFNLDAKGGLIGGEWQLPLKNSSFSLNYNYFDITASAVGFDSSPLFPNSLSDVFSGLGFAFVYDTRDNHFSPEEGFFAKTSYTVNDQAIGASDDFQKFSQLLINYWRLNEKWTAGLKLEGQIISGDYPFYSKPYIHLRGVSAMRVQGESVAVTELELQYQMTERFRILGFAGAGRSWDNVGPIDVDQSTTSGGLGIRYRVAPDFGVDMGLDFAVSEFGEAIYFQFGTAWLNL